MSALREHQQAFLDALFGRAEAAYLIRGDGLAPARRLQVYRNNLFASLSAALAADYPVVRRLVGEGFFAYAADAYIRAYPSRQGNLHAFGVAYADFLAAFAPAASLPYLPDVARLEWARHETYHAAPAPALELARLAQIAPERLPDVGFVLQPAARLIASPYPVLSIWRANQDETGAPVDLARGGEAVLVIQRDLGVDMESLDAGTHAWLGALQGGAALATATAAGLAAVPDFDLQSALARALAGGVLCAVHEPAAGST